MEQETTNQEWVKMKPAEIEKIIVELAKKGESMASIGLKLRDEHGVPRVKSSGKKLSKILKEHNLKVPGEKEHIENSIKKLEAHIVRNKHDKTAKRSLGKKIWMIK